MSAKHTPGPWKVKCFAVNSYTILERPVSITSEELEANVNLIAAAPDLLKELRNVPQPTEDETDSEFLTRYCLWLGGSRLRVLRKAEDNPDKNRA